MKKACAVAFCVSALIFNFSNVSQAWGKQNLENQNKLSTSFFQGIQHEIRFGPEISHITYKEPGIMKEKGWFYGIAGEAYLKYSLSKGKKLATGIEAKYAKGKVNYSSDISGNMDGIKDKLFETRLIIGHEWHTYKNISIMPYIGLGYRKLTDDSSGKETNLGALGYKREIKYFYVPIGVSGIYYINPNWKIKGNVEYDYFIHGKVKSHLSDVDPSSYEDIKNTQNKGYGLKIGINAVKKFKTVELSGGPYVKYWNIKESNIYYDRWGNGWIEPKNHSTEVGAMLKIEF